MMHRQHRDGDGGQSRRADARSERPAGEHQGLEGHTDPYRALFEAMPVAVALASPEGTIVAANKAMQALSGYSPADLHGRNVYELCADPRTRRRLAASLARDGTVRGFSTRLRCKDGSLRHVLLYLSMTSVGGKRVLQVVCVDVARQKRAEQALLETHAWYRTLSEECGDAVCICTSDGRLVHVNKVGLRMFGYTREEVAGLAMEQLYVNPADWGSLKREIERTGSVHNRQARLRKKDGTLMHCLLTGTAQRSPDGRIIGYQSIIRDVSEHRRLKKALRETQLRCRVLMGR